MDVLSNYSRSFNNRRLAVIEGCYCIILYIISGYKKRILHLFLYNNKENARPAIQFELYFISTSYFGSNHHSCVLHRNPVLVKMIPHNTLPCPFQDSFLIQAIQITPRTSSKPPCSLMHNSTTFNHGVIVLIFCGKFQSIIGGETISYNEII